MIYTRNHLSRVITQNQETVAMASTAGKSNAFLNALSPWLAADKVRVSHVLSPHCMMKKIYISKRKLKTIVWQMTKKRKKLKGKNSKKIKNKHDMKKQKTSIELFFPYNSVVIYNIYIYILYYILKMNISCVYRTLHSYNLIWAVCHLVPTKMADAQCSDSGKPLARRTTWYAYNYVGARKFKSCVLSHW